MTHDRKKSLQDDMRLRVLRALSEQPNISQRALSQTLGVSVGQTHYLLRALAEKGLIKISNFASSKNKMHYSYLLTAQGLSEKLALTLQFLERNRVEYKVLKAEIASLEEHLGTEGNMAQHTAKASE